MVLRECTSIYDKRSSGYQYGGFTERPAGVNTIQQYFRNYYSTMIISGYSSSLPDCADSALNPRVQGCKVVEAIGGTVIMCNVLSAYICLTTQWDAISAN